MSGLSKKRDCSTMPVPLHSPAADCSASQKLATSILPSVGSETKIQTCPDLKKVAGVKATADIFDGLKVCPLVPPCLLLDFMQFHVKLPSALYRRVPPPCGYTGLG